MDIASLKEKARAAIVIQGSDDQFRCHLDFQAACHPKDILYLCEVAEKFQQAEEMLTKAQSLMETITMLTSGPEKILDFMKKT